MKQIILTALKIVLAGALVWFVVSQIELDDRLQLPAVSAEEPGAILTGSFEGDWRSDNWVFEGMDSTGDAVRYEGPTAEGMTLLPGFGTAMGSLEWGLFLVGVLFWLVLLLFAALRWRWLLKAAGVPVTYANSFRLTIIGYFFNNVMLGSTGGDLVRAVMVTRGLETNRMRAALSVIVDRLIGLFALMLIAGTVLSIFWAEQRISEVRALR